MLRRDGHDQTVNAAHYGGLRVPHLERIPGTPDLLDEIMAPSKASLPTQ